ncbi:MAG: cation-translocating P-type ATPase [Candidatus Pacebacteria bacterium]|nr:cation-translocating P-type ATPase [Candidatus Paceibacterota bacterium]
MDGGGKKFLTGLTSAQAAARLKIDGYNELPSQKKRGYAVIFLEMLKEPMLLLLAAAGLVYFLLGEPQDALMLSSFVVFVLGITFYQRHKTERAVEALRNLSSPRALVVRDGARRRVPGREVVIGDVIVLREGDRVPADAVILESANLMADESMLTGESVPVSKTAWDGVRDFAGETPGGDNLPFVYSGTLITRGRGLVRAAATAAATRMGMIGKSLDDINEEEPLLRKETGKLVGLFAAAGAFLCAAIVLYYGLANGDWLGGILYGLTVSMSMLPEEFPVVLMIFLALGAWRMSKKKVLTRNAAAIESLGAAEILCVDKTGTITLNQMRLQAISAGGETIDTGEYEEGQAVLADKFHFLLEYSLLASQTDPFDPLEKEIRRAGTSILSEGRLHADWKLIKEYPFSGNILALSHVWEAGDGDRYIVASKGAPESIADLCHFSDDQKKELAARMDPFFKKGLRVLAVAAARVAKSELPGHQHDFDFQFAGLLGFADPIRPSAPEAVRSCYRAGVRVCMITGDYPATATNIARRIGLENPDRCLTGDDLKKMDPGELARAIETVNIFARIAPEQKMVIVNAFKSKGKAIAMTGDGVNDAPALKAAHIGIAMGERGTDVAREAADLVLLNDDFSSIVQGIKTGRSIFDNLKKAIAYIFAVHIPIAGISFLPVVMGWPVVFYPAHIAFLELIIDPACSLVFEAEPESKNVMNRPPRDLKDPLFGRREMLVSLLQGLGVLAAVFILFQYTLASQRSDDEARAIVFTAIVFANVMLIVCNLSWSRISLSVLGDGNKALYWMLGTVALTLALVLSVPFLRQVFHFAPITFVDVALSFAVAFASLLWFEIFKLFRKS